jgi:hypothetical protein
MFLAREGNRYEKNFENALAIQTMETENWHAFTQVVKSLRYEPQSRKFDS